MSAAILLHHRVGTPNSDVHALSVAPSDLRAELAYLCEHYRPVPLDELAAAAAAGEFPARAVALTFDDGYVDNLEVAAPILAEFKVPATFFLTTDRLVADEPYEFWWDVLEGALLAPGSEWPTGLRIDLPDGAQTFVTASAPDRLAAYRHIHQAAMGSPSDVRDAIVATLVQWRRPTVVQQIHRRMTKHEVIRLSAFPGHTIGAHSVRHLLLPIHSPEVQREEVAESKRTLEALLDRPVSSFAYPFGACDDITTAAVRDASFTTAVTCGDETLPAKVNALRLPRLEVSRRNGAFDAWIDSRMKNS